MHTKPIPKKKKREKREKIRTHQHIIIVFKCVKVYIVRGANNNDKGYWPFIVADNDMVWWLTMNDSYIAKNLQAQWMDMEHDKIHNKTLEHCMCFDDQIN